MAKLTTEETTFLEENKATWRRLGPDLQNKYLGLELKSKLDQKLWDRYTAARLEERSGAKKVRETKQEIATAAGDSDNAARATCWLNDQAVSMADSLLKT